MPFCATPPASERPHRSARTDCPSTPLARVRMTIGVNAGRSDIATCCGRNGRGSCSSTFGDPSSNQATTLESQMIHMIQELFGQTLSVSYTHLRAHETRHDLVCRLLLEKKKKK